MQEMNDERVGTVLHDGIIDHSSSLPDITSMNIYKLLAEEETVIHR